MLLSRFLSFVCLVLMMGLSVEAKAQPGSIRGLAENLRDSVEGRNDIEGGIWEYKVRERSGDKATVLVGKFRVKESAAFDVPGSAKGSLLTEEKGADEGSSSRPRLGVLDRITESNRGGERIGDINYKRSNNSTNATPKVSFVFDTDDDHPLSGTAQAKYDTRHGGGVWRGTYVEQRDDGKKKRWTFELRKVED